MELVERTAVKKEFEQYLLSNYLVKCEVVFSKIMDTHRKFRADYYLPDYNIIIELNGGQWIKGRHNRGGVGYEKDLTKLNLAQKNGFSVYQFTYEMLLKQSYKDFL